MQQLILGIVNAIEWVIKPYCLFPIEGEVGSSNVMVDIDNNRL